MECGFTLIIAGMCMFLLYVYNRRKLVGFKRQGIPTPPSLPIVGSYEIFLKGFPQALIDWGEKYGKIYGIYTLGAPVWIIGDSDVLREILVRQFNSFVNRRPSPTKDYPLNKAVVALENERWKGVRNLLTPAFSANKMRKIALIVNENCDQMAAHFEQKRKKPFIQCKELFGSFVMDVLASAFFGLKVNSQQNKNDPFVAHAKEGFNFNLYDPKLILISCFPKIGKLFDALNIGLMSQKTRDFFMEVMKKTVNMRSKSNTAKRGDILQMMMDAHQLQTDEKTTGEDINGAPFTKSSNQMRPLEMEELLANSMIFFMAGYETTNAALCFMAYLLANHQDVQEKLILEVDEKAPSRDDVTYDIMSSMEYLDCVVMESLRYYPPVVGTDRICNQTFEYNGMTIRKGDGIMFPTVSIHRDPEYWPNPLKFDPNRFSKENRGKNHPLAWLPFGYGPRNCLGMRLAMMEIKFAIVRLLQKYRFELCADTAIPLVLNKGAFLLPEDGIKLQVTLRG